MTRICCYLAMAAVLSAVPAHAGFLLTLGPAADLNALPGGTLTWFLQTMNSDPSLYLSIDTVNTTLILDPSQGTGDDFAAFPFPLVGPSSSDTSPLFTIQWDPGATLTYSAGSSFQIGTSYCLDANYDGCVANPDVFLDFQASVGSAAQAPEPGAFWLMAGGIAMCVRIRRRYGDGGPAPSVTPS